MSLCIPDGTPIHHAEFYGKKHTPIVENLTEFLNSADIKGKFKVQKGWDYLEYVYKGPILPVNIKIYYMLKVHLNNGSVYLAQDEECSFVQNNKPRFMPKETSLITGIKQKVECLGQEMVILRETTSAKN